MSIDRRLAIVGLAAEFLGAALLFLFPDLRVAWILLVIGLVLLGIGLLPTSVLGRGVFLPVYVQRAPVDLMELYRGRTTAQGDQLFRAYKGKWMKLTGRVHNVSLGRYVSLDGRDDTFEHLLLRFPLLARRTISHLSKGDVITAEGKIFSADAHSVVLTSCSILERTDSSASSSGASSVSASA